MVHLLAYLAGLPSFFLPAPNPCTYVKSIEIELPTSLVGGERPGGQQVWMLTSLKGMIKVSTYVVKRL